MIITPVKGDISTVCTGRSETIGMGFSQDFSRRSPLAGGHLKQHFHARIFAEPLLKIFLHIFDLY